MARSISNFRSKFHPTDMYGYFWLLLRYNIPIETNKSQ
jgi:hypothetical protein